MVRVIDQPIPPIAVSTSPRCRKKPTQAPKSSLQGLDLATCGKMSLIQTPATKQKKRLAFNDTVEVYFYPENREQHYSNEESEYEDDSSEPCFDNEEDEARVSVISSTGAGEAMRTRNNLQNTASGQDVNNLQESSDPTFEELLVDYIRQ